MPLYSITLEASPEGALNLYTVERRYVLEANTRHDACLLAMCDAFHEGLEHVRINCATELTQERQHMLIVGEIVQ